MARITHEESEKYFSQSSSEWFNLKNDGDVARVQFMLNDLSDIPIFSAHRVKLNGKDRYVDCLRNPSDPIDNCPFCAQGIPAKAVRYVVMFDHGDSKVKIWERGTQFISRLQGLINRYNPLKNYVFEIERHGKAGDKNTKYEVYPMDGVEVVDLSEMDMPLFENSIILMKSAEEMEYYLENADFPSDDSDESYEAPVRRTPVSTNGAKSEPTAAPRGSRRSQINKEEVF